MNAHKWKVKERLGRECRRLTLYSPKLALTHSSTADNTDNQIVYLNDSRLSYILPQTLMSCYCDYGLFEAELIEWSKQHATRHCNATKLPNRCHKCNATNLLPTAAMLPRLPSYRATYSDSGPFSQESCSPCKTHSPRLPLTNLGSCGPLYASQSSPQVRAPH